MKRLFAAWILPLFALLVACGTATPATTASLAPVAAAAPAEAAPAEAAAPADAPVADTTTRERVPVADVAAPAEPAAPLDAAAPATQPVADAAAPLDGAAPARQPVTAPVQDTPPPPPPPPPPAEPAPQTPDSNPPGVLSPAEPVWITADAIGMSQPLVAVGTDPNGIPIVPNHDAAWFNQSAVPGSGGNTVLWGHVLRFQYAPDIPAPFGRVKELQPGDIIYISDANNTVYTYAVSELVWVLPNQVEYILPTGDERLTLVSCIGDYVIVDGSVVNMSHRLIVIARPA